LLRLEFYCIGIVPRCAGVREGWRWPSTSTTQTPLRGSAAQFAGTGSACGYHMDQQSPRERSRDLREVSAQLARAVQENVKAAQQRLDRARNLIQVVWLMREVRRQRRERGG
jgi:hypothetical protein